ncbi:MAG: hypothetical protein L0Y66_08875 [Myxococcaceae bacterium]|nr:hypothetical protein [Myxococcaceae bacterium]MCI0670476.1 hypothetical protein [Myxococcaceae bacterium]
MGALLRALGVLGVADAVWVALAPKRWSKFWQRSLRTMSRRRGLSRTAAATELGLGLAFLLAPKLLAGARRTRGSLPAAAGAH